MSKIVAIQGNSLSKLNPLTDTSVFLAHEIQKKKYKIFYYEPKNLSIINFKVIVCSQYCLEEIVCIFSWWYDRYLTWSAYV